MINMNNIYDKTKEIYWNHLFRFNFLIALIVVLIIRELLVSNFSPDDLNLWISSKTADIYPVIATIAGTLLGFIITSISIIIAFTESDKLKLLRQTKQYNSLFNIYFNTIKSLAITTVIVIIGILANSGNIILFYICLVAVIISALFIWACIWALEQIINIVKN